jgi:hypothetical protein
MITIFEDNRLLITLRPSGGRYFTCLGWRKGGYAYLAQDAHLSVYCRWEDESFFLQGAGPCWFEDGTAGTRDNLLANTRRNRVWEITLGDAVRLREETIQQKRALWLTPVWGHLPVWGGLEGPLILPMTDPAGPPLPQEEFEPAIKGGRGHVREGLSEVVPPDRHPALGMGEKIEEFLGEGVD